jgi:hypothetical protein
MENTTMENHSKTLMGPEYNLEKSFIVSRATAKTLRTIREIMKILNPRLRKSLLDSGSRISPILCFMGFSLFMDGIHFFATLYT